MSLPPAGAPAGANDNTREDIFKEIDILIGLEHANVIFLKGGRGAVGGKLVVQYVCMVVGWVGVGAVTERGGGDRVSDVANDQSKALQAAANRCARLLAMGLSGTKRRQAERTAAAGTAAQTNTLKAAALLQGLLLSFYQQRTAVACCG